MCCRRSTRWRFRCLRGHSLRRWRRLRPYRRCLGPSHHHRTQAERRVLPRLSSSLEGRIGRYELERWEIGLELWISRQPPSEELESNFSILHLVARRTRGGTRPSGIGKFLCRWNVWGGSIADRLNPRDRHGGRGRGGNCAVRARDCGGNGGRRRGRWLARSLAADPAWGAQQPISGTAQLLDERWGGLGTTRSSTFAEQSTPGIPAPGCVLAPTKNNPAIPGAALW